MFKKIVWMCSRLVANLTAFQIRTGARRIVFMFDKFVIKVPKFYRHPAWLFGMMENLNERYWWCADGSITAMDIERYPLAPIHYADRFGLCVVMERAKDLTGGEYESRTREIKRLREWTDSFEFGSDVRHGNIGLIDDKVVVIDYGYFGLRDTYIGGPAYSRRTVDPYDDDKIIVVRTIHGKWFDFKKRARQWIKGIALLSSARAKHLWGLWLK